MQMHILAVYYKNTFNGCFKDFVSKNAYFGEFEEKVCFKDLICRYFIS